MAGVLFGCCQQFNSFPLMRRARANSPSRKGVYRSINNCSLEAGSRPTYSHHQLRNRKHTSAYSLLHTPLLHQAVHGFKCCSLNCAMARRTLLVLLVLFLFQPPACEATAPVFDVENLVKVLYVPWDTKPGSAIYRVRARDNQVRPDHPITYEVSGTAAAFFSINSINELEANLVLYSSLRVGRIYRITITATDRAGESTPTSIQINATSATATPKLKFVKYPDSPITIPENSRRGMVVTTLEARKNSNENRYPQITLTGSDKFSVNTALSGRDITAIKILLAKDLDYEEQSSYLLNVTAVGGYREYDMDTRNIVVMPVTIFVGDVQDTPPTFANLPTLTNVPVDTEVGKVIFTIQAKDGDRNTPSNINYSIEGDNNRFFRVNSAGEVKVSAPLHELLKDCQDSPIVLKFKAVEAGGGLRPSTTSDVVVLVQNPTVSTVTFSSETYHAIVDENAPINTLLKFDTTPQVTSQAGCGVIELEIRSIANQRPATSIFEVKPNIIFKAGSFQILVRDATELDYEKVQEIRFEVTARNLQAPLSATSTALVIVKLNDLNDNMPVFEKELYEVSIPETATADWDVGTVRATDADSSGNYGVVRYTDVRGEGPLAGNLAINRETGKITLTRSDHGLDRETQAKHTITVEAEDNDGIGGNRKTVEMEITLTDINDNPPSFSRSNFYFCLPASLRKSEVFWTARAIDPDEGPNNNAVSYKMSRGHELFRISERGEMYMTQDASSINEAADAELMIRATDKGSPPQHSEAKVHISWDKKTCQRRNVEYLVGQAAGSVQDNRVSMERLLTDLNGGAVTKINTITAIDGRQNTRDQERYTAAGDSTPKARTKIMATVIQHGDNAVMDLTALNQPLGKDDDIPERAAPVEEQPAGVVSDAWKWVLIALLILLALVIALLICCCLCKPTKKKTTNSSSQRSQVVEVATIGGNRHRHHHHHHRQPPPGERVSSAPTDRKAANGRAAGYSRYMQEEGHRSRKSLDGTDGDEVMVDPATGKRYRVRYENGRRILVRSGEGERGGKKVTRGTNVTENSLQTDAVENNTTPPMTVVEGDDDQKQLLKNQFLEKKSLFTIAYDGMHSKHDLLKDADDNAAPNV